MVKKIQDDDEVIDFAEGEQDLTKTFEIDHVSRVYKKRLKGSFTCKKMDIGDSIRIGVIKSQLCGGMPHDMDTGRGVSRDIDGLCDMVASCEVLLVKKPKWFTATALKDHQLLLLVCQEVNKFEASFREGDTSEEEEPTTTHPRRDPPSKQLGDDSSNSSTLQRKVSSIHAEGEEVVDGEVPTIIKI